MLAWPSICLGLPQISHISHRVRGETVAERVRADLRRSLGAAGVTLHQLPESARAAAAGLDTTPVGRSAPARLGDPAPPLVYLPSSFDGGDRPAKSGTIHSLLPFSAAGAIPISRNTRRRAANPRAPKPGARAPGATPTGPDLDVNKDPLAWGLSKSSVHLLRTEDPAGTRFQSFWLPNNSAKFSGSAPSWR